MRVERRPLAATLTDWLPLVLTAALIIFFSSQPALPAPISAQTPRGETLRQFIHVVEYSVLSLLFYRALARRRKQYQPRLFLVTATIAFGTLFALVDEGHQILVPNRDMSTSDVLVDTIGVACGSALGLIYGWFKVRSRFLRELAWL